MECSCFSAGVGRTGVFITLSIVLERMQYEGVVDVFQTVRILRTQRPAMVQTEVSACVQVTVLWNDVHFVNCCYFQILPCVLFSGLFHFILTNPRMP